MGSVLAAASPSPAPAASQDSPVIPGFGSVPPGFTMPPLSSVTPASGSDQQGSKSDSLLSNPGTYEECHQKCKGVKPLLFSQKYLDGNGTKLHFLLECFLAYNECNLLLKSEDFCQNVGMHFIRWHIWIRQSYSAVIRLLMKLWLDVVQLEFQKQRSSFVIW